MSSTKTLEDMSVADVVKAIEDYTYEVETQDYMGREEGPNGKTIWGPRHMVPKSFGDDGSVDWNEFTEALYGDDTTLDVPGLGTLKIVEDFGGEGQGDQYYFVFSVTNGDTVRYFHMGGYYQSYDGGYYDGELSEVNPVVREVTFYE